MSLTEEESNFFRFYFLNLKIATKAARVYFDYVHPPGGLASQSVTSADFDTTLTVCLLRNLQPRESASLTGWDNLPPPGDTSIGADLTRVKWYRNQSVHSKDGILSLTDFNKCWGDLESDPKDMLLELRSCNKSQQELTEKINNHQSALDVLRTNKERA
ncbi:unnamed protein product [Mytilus edulis]|uniref:DZIP3-like HEPN domain-containing protein n=1 Tax=Mytilus edulis TaxID=6550 RepID=A0A8S3PYI5_MYTED|nr:unnamed protein product [Mytilus edulis]